MKWIFALLRRACFSTFVIFTTYTLQAQSDYTVMERGPDWKVLQKTTVENGTNRVHRYVELATGLNYTNAFGQLVESKEQITIQPGGGAAATQGRHKVYFPANIYNGVIEVVTPDGRHLKSRPLGVSYDDGSNTVFIAELKSANGYLTSSNQVTYRDAFTGIKADLVCSYRRGGFECDLVFRQQPPTPGDFGLDESFSVLSMVTEFFDTQDPQQIPAQADEWFGLQDTTLKFGKLTMTHGKAFGMKNGQAPAISNQKPVYKSWLKSQGRTFLIETIPVVDLEEDLSALPLTASLTKPTTSNVKLASSQRQFPPSHELTTSTNQIQLALNEFRHEPGVVLDYNAISGGQTEYTFQDGQTYYVSGYFSADHLTIEPGAVIKLKKTGAGIWLEGEQTVTFNTTPDRPAIFTAVDDASVGDVITGFSTHSVDGYYGECGLWMPYLDTGEIHDLRFYYQAAALNIFGCGSVTIQNIEFHDCWGAISLGEAAYGPKINNVLVENCYSLVEGGTGIYGAEVTHVTATNVFLGYLVNAGLLTDSSVSFKNCLVQGSILFCARYFDPEIEDYRSMDTTGSSNNSWYAYNVGFSPLTNPAPFQIAGRAGFYLKANSPFRNAGATSIDTSFLANIQTMTTFAPQDGGMPDTNAPDLGYHYPVNEDSDHDGLPDWWEWHWFGIYSLSGTNQDAYGNTVLADFQNGSDPNVIKFTIEVTNNWVGSSESKLHLDIAAGIPSFYTVLLNSTNFAAANWSAYSSTNITPSLGSLQGWHEVWVGLKGCATNATVTWVCKRLKLDTSPPVIAITSPANATVDVPMIQLTGYSPEELDHISCDVSNTLVVITNLDVGTTHREYSTNSWEFTTNYFECLDIDLTNGVNVITIHATDMAGNETVTNFVFTLDYSSKTNPPAIQLTWPLDGANLGGSSFTMYGQVNDPTVTVTGQIVSAAGETNSLNGAVERNGRFWLEEVPLSAGTNRLTLTMTDAAGNTSVTNVAFTQSTLTLAMNPVTPESDLWKSKVNVTGVINDATQAVWVNGVKGHNNGDGTWYCNNVPTTKGGVANFVVIAYEPNEPQPDGSFGNP